MDCLNTSLRDLGEVRKREGEKLMLTMVENSDKPRSQIAYAFCGDTRNNMGNSLLMLGAMMGMDVRMVAPKENQNHDDVVEMARARAAETGARITLLHVVPNTLLVPVAAFGLVVFAIFLRLAHRLGVGNNR